MIAQDLAIVQKIRADVVENMGFVRKNMYSDQKSGKSIALNYDFYWIKIRKGGILYIGIGTANLSYIFLIHLNQALLASMSDSESGTWIGQICVFVLSEFKSDRGYTDENVISDEKSEKAGLCVVEMWMVKLLKCVNRLVESGKVYY